MKTMVLVMIMAVAAITAGCSSGPTWEETYSKRKRAFVGLDEDYIVMRFGPPHKEYSTETSKTLVWRKETTKVESKTQIYDSFGEPAAKTTHTKDHRYCDYQFTIKEGKVTHYLERGNMCAALAKG